MRVRNKLHHCLVAILLGVFSSAAASTAHAQEMKAQPGQFDYYVLNLSWAPEFCYNTRNLPENRSSPSSSECSVPHGFVLHGLWPQNFNGTWPAYCSDRPGPAHPEADLDIMPDLNLLKHEWAKHGTCTALAPETFFDTAREAMNMVQIPGRFEDVSQEFSETPASIVRLFQAANPDFPPGSFALSCGRNHLTAIEACFSKDMKPIACQNLHDCGATTVKVTAEDEGAVVQ